MCARAAGVPFPVAEAASLLVGVARLPMVTATCGARCLVLYGRIRAGYRGRRKTLQILRDIHSPARERITSLCHRCRQRSRLLPLSTPTAAMPGKMYYIGSHPESLTRLLARATYRGRTVYC